MRGLCLIHSPIWNNNGPPSCGKSLSCKFFAPDRLPAQVAAVGIRVAIATVPMIRATVHIRG